MISYRLVAVLHGVLFFGFVLLTLGSIPAAWWAPQALWPIVQVDGVVSALMLLSWPLFKGCPLTALERYLRKKATGTAYDHHCIAHYGGRMGISVPQRLVQPMLICLMLVPPATYYLVN